MSEGTNARGWGFPGASRKAHYFCRDFRSLCMKWMFTGPVFDNNHRSVDNCKECLKRAIASKLIILDEGGAS